jgi:dihydroxyacetone kinase
VYGLLLYLRIEPAATSAKRLDVSVCPRLTAESRGIVPKRIFCGPFMGSMNMPGISISLLNLTNVSNETSIPVERLLELIDAPHNSPAWPAQPMKVSPELAARKRQDAWVDVEKENKGQKKEYSKILGECGGLMTMESSCPRRMAADRPADKALIQQAMKVASEDVITSEPDLTRWDTVSLNTMPRFGSKLTF